MSNPNTSNASIEVDWRPVIWSLLWAWILMWIPTIVLALRVSSTKFTLGSDSVSIRTGITTKKTNHVELYRVRDISTSDNVFSGGRVTLAMQDGSSNMLTPVKNADTVGSEIRNRVSAARASSNVQHREDL